jgi:hypothetical protein
MHPRVVTAIEECATTTEKPKFLNRMLGAKSQPVTESIISLINGQFDFCDDCKLDLYHDGQNQLNQMRYNRLFNWQAV